MYSSLHDVINQKEQYLDVACLGLRTLCISQKTRNNWNQKWHKCGWRSTMLRGTDQLARCAFFFLVVWFGTFRFFGVKVDQLTSDGDER